MNENAPGVSGCSEDSEKKACIFERPHAATVPDVPPWYFLLVIYNGTSSDATYHVTECASFPLPSFMDLLKFFRNYGTSFLMLLWQFFFP
jgi:hypothetical protein